MKVIGLTGGIASGKSTVSMYLKSKGAVIIDADKIARQIMQKGKPAWNEIILHFGKDILTDKNEIDRKRLGKQVFSDKRKLSLLNSITHPKIINEIEKQLKNFEKNNKSVVVIDAPLLLETGLDVLVDEVWLVVVDEQTQLKRLISREEDLGVDEAYARIKSQMSLQDKKKLADRLIDNSGTIGETKEQLDKIWEEVVKLQ
ncbi:MAG TPA: dephospho-CoA kinase [Thermoanaerobacterales bacterium]|nr:dephospho-CoA kinase [Thermoanaerobacterales bacterium]